MKYGATWEMKAEYLSNLVTIKECQHISKEFSFDYDPTKPSKTKANKDEDDDFEEDEDDEPQAKSGTPKVSMLAGLACGQIPKIQESFGATF